MTHGRMTPLSPIFIDTCDYSNPSQGSPPHANITRMTLGLLPLRVGVVWLEESRRRERCESTQVCENHDEQRWLHMVRHCYTAGGGGNQTVAPATTRTQQHGIVLLKN